MITGGMTVTNRWFGSQFVSDAKSLGWQVPQLGRYALFAVLNVQGTDTAFNFQMMLDGLVKEDDNTENPFCRITEARKYWVWNAQKEKEIKDRRRREEIRRRIGLTKFHEVFGRLVYNAYPYGAIFDVKTGELVHFSERPGLFIQIAINQAEREQEEWVQRRSQEQ